MIRHVSLLKWKPETTASQVEAITTALRGLPAQIAELLDYRDHPAHRAVATELILPNLAERSALQHRV